MENGDIQDAIPDRTAWAELYGLAKRVKEMAPWEWMAESEIFGVKNPDTGVVGFVSIMGELGEHLSVAVYPGAEGLYGFWELKNADEGDMDGPLRVYHLQLSLEDQRSLTARDRRTLKGFDLQFRGRQGWPQFRSFRPGYYPWYLTAPEACFMTCALEQTLAIAPRVREDHQILTPGQEMVYLVRVPGEPGEDWIDKSLAVMPPDPVKIEAEIDPAAGKVLQDLESVPVAIEVDLRLVPVHIGREGQRPLVPYALLVVESESGFVLGNQVLSADPSYAALYGRVPGIVVECLAKNRLLPAGIWVCSDLVGHLLGPVAHALGIEVHYDRKLASLDRAHAAITEFFGSRDI